MDFVKYLNERNTKSEYQWQNRCGIHSGPLVGGIVGTKKYIYDIFGDSVNLAARLEQNSEPLKILISDKTYSMVKNEFSFGEEVSLELKGNGNVSARFLEI